LPLALRTLAGAPAWRGGVVCRYGIFSRSPYRGPAHAKTGSRVLLLEF